MQLQPNIVQAEFFQVATRGGGSLDDFKAECEERVGEVLRDIAAGADTSLLPNGLKVCIRFYDVDCSLTAFIKHSEELDEAYSAALMSFSSMTGWRKVWHAIKFSRLVKKKRSNETRRIALAIKGLTQALSKRAPVGVEDWEHRYRLLRREETHELVETARASKGAYLFLFTHNDLLADKNTLISSVM